MGFGVHGSDHEGEPLDVEISEIDLRSPVKI